MTDVSVIYLQKRYLLCHWRSRTFSVCRSYFPWKTCSTPECILVIKMVAGTGWYNILLITNVDQMQIIISTHARHLFHVCKTIAIAVWDIPVCPYLAKGDNLNSSLLDYLRCKCSYQKAVTTSLKKTVYAYLLFSKVKKLQYIWSAVATSIVDSCLDDCYQICQTITIRKGLPFIPPALFIYLQWMHK